MVKKFKNLILKFNSNKIVLLKFFCIGAIVTAFFCFCIEVYKPSVIGLFLCLKQESKGFQRFLKIKNSLKHDHASRNLVLEKRQGLNLDFKG